jgi:thiol-disulfide isomerase/thioredoxin
MVNYDEMCINSEPINQYLENTLKKTNKFQERYNSYEPDKPTIEKLKKYTGDILIYCFSAEWCSDCSRNVPVLAYISSETGIEVRVFGNLMRDAKNSIRIWACPPSPVEVNMFQIKKIPTFIIVNREGVEIGRIIEDSPENKTLEEAILDILETDLE